MLEYAVTMVLPGGNDGRGSLKCFHLTGFVGTEQEDCTTTVWRSLVLNSLSTDGGSRQHFLWTVALLLIHYVG